MTRTRPAVRSSLPRRSPAAVITRTARERGTLRATVAAYVALTKPRIIELLLVTTVPAMLLAARGWPSTGLVVATLVGGTAAAGSANALNCYLDRDIDAVMHRTARRPLNGTRVSPPAPSSSAWSWASRRWACSG